MASDDSKHIKNYGGRISHQKESKNSQYRSVQSFFVHPFYTFMLKNQQR
jgi:hypothetical protein